MPPAVGAGLMEVDMERDGNRGLTTSASGTAVASFVADVPRLIQRIY
jgi:hypothetical protein